MTENTARSRLNLIERRFVDEYLIDRDPIAAATRTGCSPVSAGKQGREALRNPVIRQAIQEAMASRSERTQITADSVLQDIRKVVARCMQEAPVLDARTGQPKLIKTQHGTLAPQYKFDAPGALKGLELLGKHLKLFADQIDISGTVEHKHTVQDNLKALGFEEFKALSIESGKKDVKLFEGGGGPVLERDAIAEEGRSDV